MLSVVPEEFTSHDDQATDVGTSASASLIDQIVRDGARRMLAEAPQAEVEAYIARFTAERDDNGRRLVVRNGSHQPREVLTSARLSELQMNVGLREGQSPGRCVQQRGACTWPVSETCRPGEGMSTSV